MAVNPVSLAESLRPWRFAGLTHFLDAVFPDTSAEQVDAAEGADAVPVGDASFGHDAAGYTAEPPYGSPRHAPVPAAGARASATTGHRAPAQAAHSTTGTQEHPARPEPDAGRRRPDVHLSSGAALDAVAARSAQRDALPQPETWPQEWQALYAQLSPAPVLWTYPLLGLDLSGQGDKTRSQTLRTIIGALQLPRGTSVFWPPSLPGDPSSAEPHASSATPSAQDAPALTPAAPSADSTEAHTVSPFFLAGVERLRPKIVVLLGQSAALTDILGVTFSAYYTQSIVGGRLHILLPTMEQLAESSQLVDRACTFLRSAFSAYPTLFR